MNKNIESYNKQIRELEKLIDQERMKMLKCGNTGHVWGETTYSPETKKEATGFEMEKHGSDVYFHGSGYVDKQVPRWKRVCKECGYEDFTYEQAPIIKGYEPKFKK